MRSRLVGQPTAVINHIRGFVLERGITVRQGPAGLRRALPSILAQPLESLSPLLLPHIEDLIDDWRRLDACIQDIYESNREYRQARRELQTIDGDTWRRSNDCQRDGSGDRSRLCIPQPAGLHLLRSDYTRMCWRLRLPTSLRELPGRYSIGAAHTNRVLLHRPPNSYRKSHR